MNKWEIKVNNKSCPYRQKDFRETYCTNDLRNQEDKNGWDRCSLSVCPLVYQPSNTAMQIDNTNTEEGLIDASNCELHGKKQLIK